MTVAHVERLSVATQGSGLDVVRDVSLAIEAGEIVGLVGETGSGKTTLGVALLGAVRRGLRFSGGRVTVADHDLLAAGEGELRALRGRVVSYVPQDPVAALDPGFRLGEQLDELLRVHGVPRAERRARAAEVLGEVQLPADDAFLRRYPHELSGGQQQRVGIAMAFANRPSLVVMDEPTTGLDVATQARILDTVRALRTEHGTAILFISHDLSMLCDVADRLVVMYAGRVVEQAPVDRFLAAPRHPYSLGLLAAVPDPRGAHELVGIPGRAPAPAERGGGCDFAARCAHAQPLCTATAPALEPVADHHAARCLRLAKVAAAARATRPALVRSPPSRADALVHVRLARAGHGRTEILHDVALDVPAGACVALVGESGSGKTTLARCLGGLHGDYDGTIAFRGEPLARRAGDRAPEVRRALQYVFQNPYSALNPRRSIGDAVAQPVRVFFGLRGRAGRAVVAESLARVGLGPEYLDRYPHELSGGERQRVAVARALAARPALLICDEVTSALDVSVQASIVNLLRDLQREGEMAMLFITHNLQLVRTIAQHVAVLRGGRVVEAGPTADVLDDPSDPYTRSLLEAGAVDAVG